MVGVGLEQTCLYKEGWGVKTSLDWNYSCKIVCIGTPVNLHLLSGGRGGVGGYIGAGNMQGAACTAHALYAQNSTKSKDAID